MSSLPPQPATQETFESSSSGINVPVAPAVGKITETMMTSDGKHVVVAEVISWIKSWSLWANILGAIWFTFDTIEPIWTQVAALLAADPHAKIDWKSTIIKSAVAIFFGVAAWRRKNINTVVK